ncbi:hypothetical protein [Tardiphaga robiniae]|uniref:hypothetical protein n=1 Tax=Tardiphaga robiniae TaxID=943830 RepID=UPI001956AA92|nr:hypothetical protein [Tardiphaga robiniae]
MQTDKFSERVLSLGFVARFIEYCFVANLGPYVREYACSVIVLNRYDYTELIDERYEARIFARRWSGKDVESGIWEGFGLVRDCTLFKNFYGQDLRRIVCSNPINQLKYLESDHALGF